MMANGAITAWRRRTGSDEAGQPTLEAAADGLPAPSLATAVTAAQVRLLAAAGLEATLSLIYRLDRTGQPAVAAGDRVQLDGEAAWHEAVRVDAVRKGALSHRVVFLKELSS